MIVALGMTMLLTSGEVDLSVGALMSFVTVIVMDVGNITHSISLGFIAVFAFCFVIGINIARNTKRKHGAKQAPLY